MYRVEIFDEKMDFVSACYTDDAQTISIDYLAYDPFQITTQIIEAKKGYFAHITKEMQTVADCIISDVQPDKNTQELSLRPLQALFDVNVFYSPVTDAITWIEDNLLAQYVTNADLLQRRPLNITATVGSRLFPLTGYNLNPTINILSVITNAFATWGVVTEAFLDLSNKEIVVNIFEQVAQQTIECDLDNIISTEITLGDSYGSTNKLTIKKTVAEGTPSGTTEITYYRHTDGSINTTDDDRIVPVFWDVTTIEQTEDMTDTQWIAETFTKAKEVLAVGQYDNEVILSVWEDDKIVNPTEIEIGTIVTLLLKGETYYSILTGYQVEGNIITLTFGAVRTELTKKLSIQNRGNFSGSYSSGGGGGGGSGGESDVSVLYFYNRTVSVASNAEILRIVDASINANTVVLECTFADPSYISGTVTWTSYEGYISFVGTCTTATTANVTLSGITEGDLYYLTPEDAVLTQGMTAIPANADLNDYKAIGTYCCSANATIPTLSNCPVTYAFKLTVSNVVGSASPTQEITSYLGETFVRTYQNWAGTWSSWHRVGKRITASVVSITIGKVFGSYASLSAPTMTGYSFVTWLGTATSGWVAGTYIESMNSANTRVWVDTSTESGGTGTVYAWALYLEN